MVEKSNNFFGQKVVIMGLGLYEQGSGISAAKFFIEQQAKVLITDLKTSKQLAKPVKELQKFAKQHPLAKLTFVLGKHRAKDFAAAKIIIRNPGVPASSNFLKLARANKIPIYTDISLFIKLYAGPILGVTGTRGKSTTATLLYQIIKAWEPQSLLGGNLGQSPLLHLKNLKPTTPVVLEISSWMAESLADLKKSPQLAIVTNILPDHLNTYKNLKEYAAAKEHLWRYQQPSDIAVFDLDNKFTKAMGIRCLAQRFWVSQKYFAEQNGGFIKNQVLYFRRFGQEQKICRVKQLKVLGEHNVKNVLIATTAALAFGVPLKIVRKQSLKFVGLANRLELVKGLRGINFYNDTTATTPDATLAALQALTKTAQQIILIAGGADKKLEFSGLTKEIKRRVKYLVLLPGAGTEKIKADLKNYSSLAEVSSMSEAVKLAWLKAKRGGVILLSPACASFGLFKNEFDRGQQFLKNIKKLK
ncbi:MAG: UDP-N-acetylmuramoyl-L-alanine--D-glutamate ligase [Candidatus Buchananbacteria bacterium]